jgi:hypothetical protein
MPNRHSTQDPKATDNGDIGDFDHAANVRRQAAWDLSMSERLARVHQLCKQMNAIKGTAQGR